jgi:hypothetical protein
MLVMGRQDDRSNALGDHILQHSHLSIDVCAALRGEHEGLDAAFRGRRLYSFPDCDVVVELGGRRHIGDAHALRTLEALDGCLGRGFQRAASVIFWATATLPDSAASAAGPQPIQAWFLQHEVLLTLSCDGEHSIDFTQHDSSSAVWFREKRIFRKTHTALIRRILRPANPDTRFYCEQRAGRGICGELVGRHPIARCGDVQGIEIDAPNATQVGFSTGMLTMRSVRHPARNAPPSGRSIGRSR